jgi:AraC family transcriptional activator of tynA and feaB
MMAVTSVRSWVLSGLAREEDKAAVARAVAETHLPVRSAPYGMRPDAKGVMRQYRVDDVDILDTDSPAYIASRTRREVEATDDIYVSLVHIRKGREIWQDSDLEHEIRAGEIIAFDSRATVVCVVPEMERKTHLRIRRGDLGLPPNFLQGSPRRLVTPAAKLLFDCLDPVKDVVNYAQVNEGAVPFIRNSIVELTLAALYDSDCSASSSASVRMAVVMAAQGYIRQHLMDLELSPLRVADAVNVSLRTLYRAFSETDESIASYIRRMRLAGARSELASKMANGNIASVAHRWGFADSSHFTRTFRAQYGSLPSEFLSRDSEADVTGSLGSENSSSTKASWHRADSPGRYR